MNPAALSIKSKISAGEIFYHHISWNTVEKCTQRDSWTGAYLNVFVPVWNKLLRSPDGLLLHFLRECRIHYNIKSSRHYFVGRPVCVLVVAIVVITWSINLKLCKYRCAKKEKTREAEAWHFRGWGIFFCNITKLEFFFTHFQIILNKQKYLIWIKAPSPTSHPFKKTNVGQHWVEDLMFWQKSSSQATVGAPEFFVCRYFSHEYCDPFFVTLFMYQCLLVPKRFCTQYFGMT